MTYPGYKEAHKRAVLAYQSRHKELGLCRLCSDTTAWASLFCYTHDKRIKARSKAQYKKRKAKRLCVTCNARAVSGYVHCKRHRAYYGARRVKKK